MPDSSSFAPLVTGLVRGFASLGASGNGAAWDPTLVVDHWTAVSDGKHNLTTDLIQFDGHFFLVHSSSPWHIASAKSRIVLWRSRDAKTWEKLKEFQLPGGDIRDPKLAVMFGRLYLYVLRNEGVVAEPSETLHGVSDDGIEWSQLRPCGPKGWLFWRHKSLDEKTWFVPAYWNKHGKSLLLSTTDGETWKEVSSIHEGDHNDETDIEFMEDGSLMATARLEGDGSLFGHSDASTLVAVAKPPYTEWRRTRCRITRLDGPNLFRYRGEIFALGRQHLDNGKRWRERGSCLGKKRTSLYHVSEGGLQHLSDLPSCGDTGYPGLVLQGDTLFVSYYTNDVTRDFRWITGMFLPSQIRMAKLSLAALPEVRRLVGAPAGTSPSYSGN